MSPTTDIFDSRAVFKLDVGFYVCISRLGPTTVLIYSI